MTVKGRSSIDIFRGNPKRFKGFAADLYRDAQQYHYCTSTELEALNKAWNNWPKHKRYRYVQRYARHSAPGMPMRRKDDYLYWLEPGSIHSFDEFNYVFFENEYRKCAICGETYAVYPDMLWSTDYAVWYEGPQVQYLLAWIEDVGQFQPICLTCYLS